MKTATLLGVTLLIITSCSYFEAPETPTGLTALYNESEDCVEINWDDVDGAREYIIFRGATATSLTEISSGDDGAYNDYDYDYYQQFYAVEASNNTGSSGMSEAVEADLNNFDSYETDNTIATAKTLVLEGDAPSQKHSIMPVSDVDFIKFAAQPPYGYNIEVPAESSIPLKLTLFDEAGNELASDSDGTGIYIARIGEWAPSVAGNYYVKIEAKTSTGEGYYRIFIHEWE
ncbi:hypothetical protein HQ531_03720 [bacterium]|nr:hypothetical protein [bacterium]